MASMPIPPVPLDLFCAEKWAAFLLSGWDHLGHQATQCYWAHKQQLNEHSYSLVDWETLDKATASSSLTFQMWLLTFASGHLAVATTVVQWKRWASDLCPLCQSTPETTQHILCCPSVHCSQACSQQTEKFCQWLILLDTAPAI